MSYLLHDSFDDNLPIETTIRIPHKGIYLDFLRTHCLKSGTVSGTFTCTLLQNDVELSVATITAEQINSIPATYAHGFFRWEFANKLRLHVNPEDEYAEYQLKFESQGYVATATDFFELCKDFDNQLVPDYGIHFQDDTPEEKALSMPYGIELYRLD